MVISNTVGALKFDDEFSSLRVVIVNTYDCSFKLNRNDMIKIRDWMVHQLEKTDD